MSIPIPTTTISAFRPDPMADEYENDNGPTTVQTGVSAHIGDPKGRGAYADGAQWEAIDKKLVCDIFDLKQTDVVRDDNTDAHYWVQWVDVRRGLGLDHMVAGLKYAEGVHF